jgi:hypothetical protein
MYIAGIYNAPVHLAQRKSSLIDADRTTLSFDPEALDRLSFGNLSLKKPSCEQTGELCPNFPKIFRPSTKNQFDNIAKLRYLDNYCFRLIDASICWAAAEADTQFAFFA